MPSFTEQAAASDLLDEAYSGGECASDGWHEDRQKLRTSRNDLLNLGSSLFLIGAALTILLGWLSSHRLGALPVMRTPAKKTHFFVLGILLVLGVCLGMIIGLDLDLGRGMFAPCADSIAIPIFGYLMSLPFVLGICLIVGFGCSVNFGVLPVSLWQWDHDKPEKSWAISLLFGGVAAFLVFLVVSMLWSADFLAIGPFVFAIYLTLATRAAILAPR